MTTGNHTDAMPEVVRTHGGMPDWCLLGIGTNDGKLALYWPYTSEINGERFLTRFIVVRNPWFSVDITRISMPDDDKRMWPHDHSRTFWSWKFGSYDEWVYSDPSDLSKRKLRRHPKFSLHRLRHTEAHSITRVSPGLVTVLFLGRKRQKSSYWTPKGKRSIGMKVDQ